MVVVVGNELVEEVQGGLEGWGWRGGGVGWRGGGGGGGLGVPHRTEPSARNTAQYIPARQYRTVPILNSYDYDCVDDDCGRYVHEEEEDDDHG